MRHSRSYRSADRSLRPGGSMYPSRRLVAVLLLICQALTGCSSWRVQSVSPREFIASDHPEAVRVRDTSGTTFVLQAPYIAADSLGGTMKGTARMVPLG